MANDLRIQIESQFNAGPIKAGIADAANAVQVGTSSMQAAFARVQQSAQVGGNALLANAAALGAQGLSAKDASSALQHLGYSMEQASAAIKEATIAAVGGGTAIEELGVQSKKAAADVDTFKGAMGAARVEMGAVEGSLGMMAGGLARVAGQSALLGPIINAAFPVFAAGALIDITVQLGEKLYTLYQNIVNDKQAFDALNKIEQSLTETSKELAKAIEQDYIGYLKLVDPIESAREKLRSVSSEEFKFKVNDKELKALPDDLAKLVQSISGLPASQLDDKMRAVASSISRLKDQLTQTREVQAALVAQGLPFVDGTPKIEKEIELLRRLSTEMEEFGTKVGLQQRIGITEVGKAQEEQDKKTQDAADRATKKKEEADYRHFESLNAEQELSRKGAAEELKQIEERARKQEAADNKALEDSYKDFEGIQSQQEDITRKLTEEITKRNTLRRQEAETDATIQARIDGAAKKSADDRIKAFEKGFAPINRGFDTMVKGVLLGTQTMGQAFARLGSDIVLSTVSALGQALLRHLEHEIAVTAAHVAGIQAQVAASTAGAAQQNSISLAAHLKEILLHAKAAAAGAFHWVMSTVPFPLDVVLAPAAAAGAFAAVMGFAEQGAVLPHDMLVQAHKNEMILPPAISQGLQAAIATGQLGSRTGSPAGSTGGATHNHQWNISAIDGPSTADFFRKNQDRMIRMAKSAIRNGHRF